MVYRVFISHAYDHREIYYDLVKRLSSVKSFDWRNKSVQYDMRHGHEDEQLSHNNLRKLIGGAIETSDVLLALTKPIVARRAWLQWEINLAKDLGIPVIGIARYKKDNVSRFVREHANDIVDTWRVDHIINAIKWEVAEANRVQAAKISRLPPLVPSPSDEELEPIPSPDDPPAPEPEFATTEPETGITGARSEAIPHVTAESGINNPLPQDVLKFPGLGGVVPERLITHREASSPRWWKYFGRQQ